MLPEFVWEALKGIHIDVHEKVEGSGDFIDEPNTKQLNGIAKRIKGKWIFTDSDQYTISGNYDYIDLEDSKLKKYKNTWKWVDKYINVSHFFNTYPPDVEDME